MSVCSLGKSVYCDACHAKPSPVLHMLTSSFHVNAIVGMSASGMLAACVFSSIM
jgi:hypothetical protein